MKFELPDKNQLYYEHIKHGEDLPTIVFLNGLSQSTVSWAILLYEMGNRFNVLVYDAVFQGNSTAEGPYRDFHKHAEDLHLLLEELKIEKPVIFGLSFGGFIAQHYCHDYPSDYQSAYFVSTACERTPHFRLVEESWWAALKLGGYFHFLDIIMPYVLGKSYLEAPMIPMDQMREMREKYEVPAENLEKLMEATLNFEGLKNLKEKPTQPHYIVAGEEDLLFPEEEQKKMAQIWQAEISMLPKKGHTLNLEAAKALVNILDTHLNR